MPPHFGLGDCPRVERVHVRWPSGAEQAIADVPADQVLHVREPGDARPAS
jgi:hypothetical protein